jgi:hypothetical protein
MGGRRGFLIIGRIILISFFGGLCIFWLNDKCPHLSRNDCQLMWGTAMASVLGGLLFGEVLIARKRTPREPQSSRQNTLNNKTKSLNWYVWVRPIAWVTLSALLGGLPLIVQGAFVLTFSGVMTGLLLNVFVRTTLNRLPPLEDDKHTSP